MEEQLSQSVLLLGLCAVLSVAIIWSITFIYRIRSRKSVISEDESDSMIHSAGGLKDRTSKHDKREHVLLCGPSNAGKTMLLQNLLVRQTGVGAEQAEVVHSVRSIKALECILLPTRDQSEDNGREKSQSSVGLVDIPGHFSFTNGECSSLVRDANRVVFVLDSTKPIKEGATLLFSLLTSLGELQNGTDTCPILVACSKADLPRAKNPSRIKLQLKQELERIQKTHTHQAGDQEVRATTNSTLPEKCSELLNSWQFVSVPCTPQLHDDCLLDVSTFILGRTTS